MSRPEHIAEGPETLLALKRAEAETLTQEARDMARKRPGHARITAMWAGISARDAGMAAEDNPFLPEQPDLRDGWATGFAMRRQAPLPKAQAIRLPNAPRTHASATHEVLS
ncbi:MAG: hypothetical protein AB1918_19300 [Pseudomonadota bacterium]